MEEPSTHPQTQSTKPLGPETVASAAPAPESKKRKLEDGEFRNSKYFKMRTIVKDLRPLFIEVLQAPDFRNSKAAQNIQEQMKIVMELSKELMYEVAAHGKAQLAGATKEGHTGTHQEGETHTSHPRTGETLGKHQGGETHASHPQTAEIPSAPKNKLPKVAEKEPLPSRVRTGPNLNPPKAPEENIRGAKEYNVKQFEEGFNKSYVVGGSPIGWNFQFYPGGETVYCGVTKASAIARRAGKVNP